MQTLPYPACPSLASLPVIPHTHQSLEQALGYLTFSAYALAVPFAWVSSFPHVPVAAYTSELSSHLISLI